MYSSSTDKSGGICNSASNLAVSTEGMRHIHHVGHNIQSAGAGHKRKKSKKLASSSRGPNNGANNMEIGRLSPTTVVTNANGYTGNYSSRVPREISPREKKGTHPAKHQHQL